MGQEEQINYYFKLEELKALRTEISNDREYVQKIFYWTITLSVGIYSIGLQKASILNAIIVMLPTLYANFAYYWILTRIYSTKRIIKYITEHLEERGGFNWETNLSSLGLTHLDSKSIAINLQLPKIKNLGMTLTALGSYLQSA